MGFVDMRVLVDMTDGKGTVVKHAEIPNVPYCRIQGGPNALIVDPQVGDIGIALFCSRDISAIKSVKKSAPPGSWRMHSFSDALYIGGILNQTPTSYIQIVDNVILINNPTAVTINTSTATVNADSTVINSTTTEVNSDSVNVTAATVAINSGAITMGDGGSEFKQMVNSTLVDIFNAHTHPTPSGESSPPNQTIGAAQLTNNTKAN